MKRLNTTELFERKESIMEVLNTSKYYKEIRESRFYDKAVSTLFNEVFDDCIDDLYDFRERVREGKNTMAELKAIIRIAFKRPIVCFQIFHQTEENMTAIRIISHLIVDSFIPSDRLVSKNLNCYASTYLMNKLVFKK